MLISFGNLGQFGNLYLSSAHRIAHAIAHNYRLHLCDLGKYLSYLNASDPSGRIRFGGKSALYAGVAWGRLSRRLIGKSQIQRCGLSLLNDLGGTFPITNEALATQARSKTVIHNGWGFRDRPMLQQEIETVRSILRLKPEFEHAAASRMEKLRSNQQFVIGVHIRRGDYRNYRGGSLYFDESVYQKITLEAVRASGTPPEKTAVIGFSNEPLDWPDQIGGAQVKTPAGNWWEDFLCLSMCDLIIGPPSTFSGAASLAGNVKWFQINPARSSYDPSLARPYVESGISVH